MLEIIITSIDGNEYLAVSCERCEAENDLPIYHDPAPDADIRRVYITRRMKCKECGEPLLPVSEQPS